MSKRASIHKRLRALAAKVIADLRLMTCKTVTLSLGENCLTDNILDRHGIKSFATPYSHGRSNLDYAIQLEATGYADLLNPAHLRHEKFGELTVVRNREGFACDPIFLDLHRNGFEFTHHDVIGNPAHLRSMQRKIGRMGQYRGRKHFRFFYHYRVNAGTDLDRIFAKAREFAAHYQLNGKRCEMIVFTQRIIADDEPRDVKLVRDEGDVKLFVFETRQIWGGEDEQIMWARIDDDLIRRMLDAIG